MSQGKSPMWRSDSIRPYQPRKQAVSVWERPLIVASNGKNFTNCKLYVYQATPTFPEVTLNCQISSGSGSVYFRMSPENLKNLIAYLQVCDAELSQFLPDLQAKAKAIQDAEATMLEQMQTQMRAAKLMADHFAESEPPED